MDQITIRNKQIGIHCPMFIIAEAACAHEGDFKKLIQLIDIAIATGADAVKFQVLNAQSHMAPSHRIYELVKTLEFSKEQWIEAIQYVRSKSDILILIDIYDEYSIDTVAALDPNMIKIHSADLNNYRLLEKAAQLNKPTLMGVGASRVDEIRDAISFYQKHFNGFVGLLHGYQAFPTQPEDLNINQIRTLQQYFNLPVGFLDHTEGDSDESMYMPLVARGAGAFAVEKHITIDRAEKGIDYESALSLDNFKKMVSWIRKADIGMGSPILLPLSAPEIGYRSFMKKNIVAATDLKKGDVLTEDKIALKRSGNGITAENYPDVLNKQLKTNLAKDDNILLNNIE
jgi:N,N'-diacetyllegionaminate synthase